MMIACVRPIRWGGWGHQGPALVAGTLPILGGIEAGNVGAFSDHLVVATQRSPAALI